MGLVTVMANISFGTLVPSLILLVLSPILYCSIVLGYRGSRFSLITSTISIKRVLS